MTDLDSKSSHGHNFAPVSVCTPQLCVVCDDYIVSPECRGARCCLTCGCLFHALCAQWVDLVPQQKLSCCFAKPDGDTSSNFARNFSQKSLALSDQPLANWTGDQVIQWLIVTGLSRYYSLFRSGNINGQVLSLLLTPPTPLNDITDPFCRRTLKRAIMTLMDCQCSPGALKLSQTDVKWTELEGSPHHNLRLTTFTMELCCCVCHLPVLGLSLQGFQCTACGSVFHRVCSHILKMHPECPMRFVHNDVSTFPLSEEFENQLLLPSSTPFIEQHFFGVPLDMQECDANSVPIFLSMCTQQFEQLANSTFDDSPSPACRELVVDCLEIYRTSALTTDLQEMRIKYSAKLPSLNDLLQSSDRSTSLRNLVHLAQMIKFFLRELPEPVIPSEHYERLLELLSDSPESRRSSLENILSRFSARNLNTLRHVMRHLGYLWYHQRLLKLRISKCTATTNNESDFEILSRRDDLRMILLIFSHILLRPGWHDILKSVGANVGNVLEIMFNHFVRSPTAEEINTLSPQSPAFHDNYIDLLGQETSVVTYVDKLTSIALPPTQKSMDLNRKDLEDRVWYWGDISRSEVAEVMRSQPDGSFLVRDASIGSTSAFTLTERRNFNNNLFRIYHSGDFFGFKNPPDPQFKLVSELINFCMRQCHASFSSTPTPNSGVPRLLHPVPRGNLHISPSAPFTMARESGGSRPASESRPPTLELQEALKRLLLEISTRQANVEALNRQSSEIMQQMESTSNLLRAHKKLMSWLHLQRERLLEAQKLSGMDATAETTSVLIDNRLTAGQEKITCLQNHYTAFLASSRAVCDQNVLITHRQRKLMRQAQEIGRELTRRGVPESVIINDSFGDDDNDVGDDGGGGSIISDESAPHIRKFQKSALSLFRDETAWFRKVSRIQAESILLNLPTGGFLIRPSAVPKQLALSVKVADSVQHCLIYCVNGKYGFTETTTTFNSLQELVVHYHFTSLLQHNPVLNTTLTHPAFASV